MNAMGMPNFCNGYIGKRVRVRTKTGAIHEGVLHSITKEGLILRPVNGTRFASAIAGVPTNDSMQHAIASHSETEATEAWWPVWFLITFALIAGFWGWGAGGWNGYYGTKGYAAPYGGYGGFGGYGGYGGFGRRVW